MKKKKNYGFSLVELLVVVSIIAVLAGIAIPSYNRYKTKARRAEAHSKIVEIINVQKAAYKNRGSYSMWGKKGGGASTELQDKFIAGTRVLTACSAAKLCSYYDYFLHTGSAANFSKSRQRDDDKIKVGAPTMGTKGGTGGNGLCDDTCDSFDAFAVAAKGNITDRGANPEYADVVFYNSVTNTTVQLCNDVGGKPDDAGCRYAN